MNVALKTEELHFWTWDIRKNEFKSLNGFKPIPNTSSLSEGKTLQDFIKNIYSEDRPRVEEFFHHSVKNKATVDISFRLVLSDGHLKWVNNCSWILFSNDNEPMTMMGALIPIDNFNEEAKTLFSEEYEQTVEELLDCSAHDAMAKFIHELNQPITVIHAYLSGCIRRLQDHTTTLEHMLIILKKVIKYVEILTSKMNFIQTAMIQKQDISHNIIGENKNVI